MGRIYKRRLSYAINCKEKKILRKLPEISQNNIKSSQGQTTDDSWELSSSQRHASQSKGSQRILRQHPQKRLNESDSEFESEESVRLMLLKKKFRWIFVDDISVLTLTPVSDSWPKMSYCEKYTMLVDSKIFLTFKSKEYECRLLCKGPEVSLKGVEDCYLAVLNGGANPSELKSKNDDLEPLMEENDVSSGDNDDFLRDSMSSVVVSNFSLGGGKNNEQPADLHSEVIVFR